MNYMMAFYSGLLLLTFYSNLNHIMVDLKKSNVEYTRFYNLTATSWTFKPLFGWISDSFYPFRYRFKSYIILMACIHATFCIVCQLNPNSYSNFFICVFMIYFAVAFVDTMGEGMTAVITKMENRIAELTPPELQEEKKSEGKAIGFFFMFRLIIQSVSIFLGGSLSSNGYSIRLIYIILLVAPSSILIYTIFVFKEARKPKVWNGCTEIMKSLKEFVKVFFNPGLFFPLFYSILLIAIPSFTDVCNFILLNKGGWTLEQVSFVNLSTGVIFALGMIWFLDKVSPKMPNYLNYIIGALTTVISNLMNFYFLEPQQLGYTKMFIVYWS